jgi:hypothetical protein
MPTDVGGCRSSGRQRKGGSLHLLARHSQRTTEVALVPLRRGDRRLQPSTQQSGRNRCVGTSLRAAPTERRRRARPSGWAACGASQCGAMSLRERRRRVPRHVLRTRLEAAAGQIDGFVHPPLSGLCGAARAGELRPSSVSGVAPIAVAITSASARVAAARARSPAATRRPRMQSEGDHLAFERASASPSQSRSLRRPVCRSRRSRGLRARPSSRRWPHGRGRGLVHSPGAPRIACSIPAKKLEQDAKI